jgi:aminoglycoside phosphotransferase family enzyme/predicted kinase
VSRLHDEPMDLRTDLLRPEAYGALHPERVELVETHISWVLLADDDVFKVKKPVDLGFLDFRTTAQRKVACEAEVRLNARLAPDVYRGVVPVRVGEDGRGCIGGAGPVVDWAVHMARLPDERRADVLLGRGKLSNEDVSAIAERVAAFHAAARGGAKAAPFGAPEAIATNIEENFAQTRDSIHEYLSAGEADEIVRWQTAFVRGRDALFTQRIAEGRIRDGHGDLRLEHVYLDASRPPTIIDCIEYNDRFRFGDVCADIAFLSMDLAAHGRVDFAELLLARYARESNDFDLYALVDFYESYRAFVRGKVAVMVAADGQMAAETRQRAERDARRYFLLALSADRRAMLRPALVAVGGIIASGKSTLAERIAGEMSAPVVATDRTRKGMLGVQPGHPVDEPAWKGAYDPVFTEAVYAEVLRRADVVLASGRPVVLDASFHSRAMRRAGRELANRHGVAFHFVECRADLSVCRSRLGARARESSEGGVVSDGRLEIFDAFCARVEPVVELPADDHVVVDTTRPLEDSLAEVRRAVDAWPPGLT